MKHNHIIENTPINPHVRCDVNINTGTPFFMNIGFKTPSIFQHVLSNKFAMTGTCISVFLIGSVVSIVGCSLIYKHMKMKYKYNNRDRLTQHEVDRILEMEKKHLEKKEREKNERDKMKKLGLYFNDYITKYSIEYISTKERDFNESCFIQEFTPDGGIFMKYNVKSDVFWYWSDSTIRYRVLDTVARKFCTTFRCRQFYMDIEKEEKEKEKEKEKESDTEGSQLDKDNNSDNNNNDINSNGNGDITNNKKNAGEPDVDDDDDSFLFIDSQRVKNVNNRDNNKPIEEKTTTLSLSNKKLYFIRKGSVRDFSTTLKEITHLPKEKQISYKDFKEFIIK